jgi:hypothetical protein
VGGGEGFGGNGPKPEPADATLRPRPPAAGARARVVGPGRRERHYLESLERLQAQRAADERRAERLAAELATAERVERGCQKHIDRLEQRLDDERRRTHEAEGVQKRLLVVLGALQRENQLLRARLDELPGPKGGSNPPAKGRALPPRAGNPG